MTEMKDLLSGIASLLWPLIIIVILYLLRHPIIAIIRSAKSRQIIIKLAGQELTIGQAIEHVNERQDHIENKVKVLQLLIKGFITDFEYEKLKGLASDNPFIVRFHWDMYRELRRLDALRYIQPQPGYGIDSLQQRDGTGNEFNLKQYVYITLDGREYLKLRDEVLQLRERSTND